MERSNLTKAMRWRIADRLAEERLEIVNECCPMVKVKNTFYTRYVKRTIDVIASLIVLVITSPINLIIGIITLWDVGSPILFKQRRLGKDGKLFDIVKFRNMKNIVDERGELLPPSQRITKFGEFVRRTSLDELLNFWSVLKGDMSLIGPRPLLPEHLNRYSNRHKQRLAVKPGLECPPQKLNGHVWTWEEQFENDVWYVENVGFITDCKMFIRLIRFALDRKSTSARASVTRGIFMGYDLNGIAITLEQVPQHYIDEVAEEMLNNDNEYIMPLAQ